MAIHFSRRAFARLLGATAGASLPALPAWGAGVAPETAGADAHQFPHGFLWGSATASYQVEGTVKEDGRGPSIWDTFSHTPGKTHNGDTGDVADDHYHRYKEDVQLMKNLGLKTYRFSVSWSRVFPEGTGAPNPKGLDFYNRMLDELLAAGIAPYCTLYHWDLPQVLQDRGGWENRDTAKAFADYAGYTAGKLSDRVKHFMTMNELRTFVELGYSTGFHAPGLKLDAKGLAQVSHHAVLGHGMAVQAIRASAKPGTKVGLADNLTACTPVFDAPEHVEAAGRATREENAMFLTVIQEGRYTDGYLKRLGAAAPKFTAEELAIIGSKLDFTGINIYTPAYVRADDSEKGYAMVPSPASYPHMFSPWLTIGPEALYWAPKLVAKLWNVKEIYITENGASSADVPTPEGRILDTDRVMYLRNYLTQLHRAVAEGVPVKGYFLWSLLDNYEWADGYEKRFGIHYVDFKTQKRTPKLSAEFYREVIARNSVA
ncbi:GH1 family beta-glucosidase [Granulicella arctica]|uniref:Beta-glucosidase n=1 Tax=Granulicella arctica TaxID=940613 RepID=A0A7Y9TK39_9BACT|nr:GH1 family beta-glucosidase [Granulicella arctica]NYF78897.1 beta-glucosidase [Granulicella arctica]